jgi:hypothetical protein
MPETLAPVTAHPTLLQPEAPLYPHDFAAVKGHAHVKRALEVRSRIQNDHSSASKVNSDPHPM